MVLLELSMYPLDKGESLGRYVARLVDIIDRSGVPYKLTPMGSILEGEWSQLMGIVNECFAALQGDCDRIVTQVRVDYRKNTSGRLTSKIESIEQKLGRKLRS